MNHEYYWQKGSSRYYKVLVYKDLFGDWVLTKVWGGIGTRLGNYNHMQFTCTDTLMNAINEIKERRMKRGYKLL